MRKLKKKLTVQRIRDQPLRFFAVRIMRYDAVYRTKCLFLKYYNDDQKKLVEHVIIIRSRNTKFITDNKKNYIL